MIRGIRGRNPANYKNPFDEKYLGHPDRITSTQKELWPILSSKFGLRWAVIGGKGAAKTMLLAAWLLDGAQKFRGSKAFLAASSYQQAIDSCAVELVKAATIMDIELIYRDVTVLDSIKHTNVYILPEYGSSICIRSADRMNLIEGSKWDRGAIEEVSFWWDRERGFADLKTAVSRVRRSVGDNGIGIVGMPEDEEHPMYEFLERWTTVLPDGTKLFKEISMLENLHNLPDGYEEDLHVLYPGDEGRRYIEGKRISLHRLPVLTNFRIRVHKSGKLSERYTSYDPYLPLLISFDFNVAPCCVTIWQIKMIRFKDKNSPQGYMDREIMCQIDEFEGWRIGTEGVCDLILEYYEDHRSGGVIVGDASGNAEDTRSVGVTDWSIIEQKLGSLHNMSVKKGLIVNRRKSSMRGRRRRSNEKDKLAKYNNPPLKDSIINLNRLLLDGRGYPSVLFLPESKYESGGAAKSCSYMKYKPDGRLDESNDKKSGREVVRTHYFATARYAAWHFSPPKKTRTRGEDKDKVQKDYELNAQNVF